MIYKINKLCVLILFSMCVALSTTVSGEINFTDIYTDFFGYCEQLEPGDIITAYDSDGILCGKFEVKESGKYGFMHVYGDDITSPNLDEGPVEGDILTFYVNDIKAITLNQRYIVWSTDTAKQRIDLEVRQ
jgi:hypothetical protein